MEVEEEFVILETDGMPMKESFYDGEEQVVDWRFILISLVVIAVYVCLGMSFYHWVEGWPVVDALYVLSTLTANALIIFTVDHLFIHSSDVGSFFTAVTVSSLGYSDLFPQDTKSRIFTMVYILVGISMAGKE